MRPASRPSRLLHPVAAVLFGAGALFAVEVLAAWSAAQLILIGLR